MVEVVELVTRIDVVELELVVEIVLDVVEVLVVVVEVEEA